MFPYHNEYFPHAENLDFFFVDIVSLSGICGQNNQRKYNTEFILSACG